MYRRGRNTQEVRVRTTYSPPSYHRSRCCDEDETYRPRQRTPTYGTYIYTRAPSPSDCGYRNCYYEEPPAPRYLCHRRGGGGGGGGGHTDRVVIEVRRRHEPSFNIRVSVRTRPEDVIAQLAPDHRRDEIVVHWRSGGCESLCSSMAMDTVVSNARYLEVKTKTRYHWR